MPTAVSTPTSLLTPTVTPTATSPAPTPIPGQPSIPAPNPNPNPNPTPTTPAPVTPTAPKSSTPTIAPAPSPTYSFLNGSTYNSQGKQISPPSVITSQPAVTDLQNKQAALTQATTAQAQQAQTIANQPIATPPTPTNPAGTSTGTNTGTTSPAQTSTSGLSDIEQQANDNAVQANQALQAVQAQSDAAYAQFQSSINQVINGSFPLTPAQQASVTATQNSFNQLVQAQQIANANFEGQVRLSGLSGVAPSVNLGLVQDAVSADIQKISTIDSQASAAVAQLQQGFMQQDYTMINDAYTAASNAFAAKTTAINDMASNAKDATTTALQIYQQQQADAKAQADQAQQQLQNQQAAIQFAVTNGITQPYYLVGNTAIDASTGQPVTLAQYQAATGQQVGLPENQTDFSKIQPVASPQVTALMNAYPDAGINPTDTAQQAQAKLGNSALYRKATYIAPSSSAANLTPADLEGLASTLGTYNGQAYLTPTDLTGYTTAQKGEIVAAFKAAGTPTLSPKDGDAIDSILAAQQDIVDLQTALNTSTIQPKGFLGRPIAIANATLGSLFQVNNSPALDTFNLSAIPLLTALKGAGSGGGGGAARLFNTVTNYLPQKTDTVTIANQKIANLQKLLDNGATSILGSYGSSSPASGQAIPAGTDGATYGYPGYVSDGTQWVQQSQ